MKKPNKIYINKFFAVLLLAVMFLSLENQFANDEKIANPIREIEYMI